MLTFMLSIHIFISALALLIANACEDSVVTDRTNKYVFLSISVLYSLLVVPGFMKVLETINDSSLTYNNSLVGLVLLFILIQVLVYRVLNQFEINEA